MKVSDIRDASPEPWRPGVETRMLVSARNGATQLCVFEQWVAPGIGAPTHSHPVEEVLSVRDGEAEMCVRPMRVCCKRRSLFRHVREIAANRPAMASEIIPQVLSVPQNPVRLVVERWFATGLLHLDRNGA